MRMRWRKVSSSMNMLEAAKASAKWLERAAFALSILPVAATAAATAATVA